MNRIYKVIWNEVRHCYMVASELTRTHTKPASVHKEGRRKSQKALTLAVLITLTSAALMWTPVAYADGDEDYIGVAHYKYADGTEINDEGGLNYNGRGTYTIGESATVSEKKGVTGAITVGVDAGAGKKTVTIGDRYANQSAYSVLLGQQSRYARLTYDGVQKSKETISNPSKIGVDTEESIGTGVIAIGYNSRASNKDSLNTSEDYKTYDAVNIGDQSVTDNFKEMAYDTATSSVTKKAVANTLKTNGAGGAIAIGYNAKADGGNIAIGTNATAFRKNDTDDSYVSFGNDGYVETIYLEGTTTTDGTTTQNTATVWHDGVNRRLTHVAAGTSANEAATVGQVISLVGDTYTNGNEIKFNTTYKQDASGNYLDDYGNVVYTKNSDGTYHKTSDTRNDESTTTDFSEAAKIYEVAVNPTGTVSADDTSKVVSGATVYNEVRPTTNGSYVKSTNTTAANLTALDNKIGTIATSATTTDASTEYNYINTDANTSISQNLVNLDQKVKAAIDATTYTAGDSITISGDKNAISVNHILRQNTTGASVGTGSWVIGGDASGATGTTGATGNSAVTIGGSGNILASGQNSVVVGGTSGKAVGKNSVNIGGSNGYADGENSVAIGGGITSTNSAIAIGSGAVATKSNSMAIGYQSVADDENTIAFGHDANDETGAVNSSGQKYGTASYNRLVKVGYGQVDHDVATMAQRTKLTTTTDNNAPITVSEDTDKDTLASTYTITANTGDVGAGKTTLVTGDTVNTAITTEKNARESADTALSDRIGTLTTDGNYIKVANTVSQNLSSLDTQVKQNASNIGQNTTDITKNAENITNNTTEITNLKDLSNITDKGKTVIQNLSKDAVKVAAGDRVNVDAAEDADGNKTYTVSAKNDGKVESGNTNLVSGNTVNTAIQSAISGQQTQLNADLAKKADADAGNLTDENVTSWQNKLGGSIASDNAGFVSGKDVYEEIHVEGDGSYVKSSNTVAQNFSALDSQVKTNADGIAENKKSITDINNSITNVTNSVDKKMTAVTVEDDKAPSLDDVTADASGNKVATYTGNKLTLKVTEDNNGQKTYNLSLNDNLGDLSADSIIIGKDGKDGNDGKNGEIGLVGQNGAEGQTTTIIKTIGSKGTDGTNGTPGVNGKDGITRIVYQDGTDGTTSHTVATLDDGMKFVGDSDDKVVAKKLNDTLTFHGGAGTVTDNNIAVDADSKNVMHVRLANDITLVDSNHKAGSITFGDNATSNTKIDASGLTVAGGPSVTTTGIDAGGTTITNVKSDRSKTDNVATIGDVNELVSQMHTSVSKGIDDSDTITVDSTGTNYKLSVNAKGTVTENDKGIVTGGTVYAALNNQSLNFAGDHNKSGTDNLPITVNANKQVKITGTTFDANNSYKATDWTTDNISVTASAGENNGANLSLELKKDLKLYTKGENGSSGSVQFGEADGSTKLDNSGLNVENGPSITAKGITNLARGGTATTTTAEDGTQTTTYSYDDNAVQNNAATIADAKDIAQQAAGSLNTAVEDLKKTTEANLAKKADVDAGNLTAENVTSWQNKLGGSITENNAGFVTGGDVYKEIHLDNDGSYVKSGNTVAKNLSALDSQVKTNADGIGMNASKIATNTENITKNTESITQNTSNITNNTNEITNLKNLSNITDEGKKVITNLSKGAVKVAQGDRVTVGESTDTDGAKVYTVSANNDGTVTEGDSNLVSGGTVYSALHDGSLTELNVGRDGKDGAAGKIGLAGKNGADGMTMTIIQTIGSKGTDGTNGTPGVDGKAGITRIVYQDGTDGTTSHTVATLDDGLKFVGDTSDRVLTKKLNDTLTFSGGAGKVTEGNISVDADSATGTMRVRLGRDIKLVDSNHAGGSITFGDSTTEPNTKMDASGLTVAGGPSVTTAGINAGGKVISNLASGNVGEASTNGTNAATIQDARDIAKEAAGSVEADVKALKGVTETNLAAKADADAGNLTEANVASWQNKLGGSIAENNSGFVTGKDVYQEIHLAKDGEYVKSSNTVAQNLSSLDSQVKTNADAISTNAAKITKNTESISKNAENITKNTTSITNNTTAITNLQNGEGFTAAGNTYLKNLSKDAVKVAAGDRVSVDTAEDTDGNKTYTVSAKNDGKVESGNTNLVSGDTVNTAITNAVNTINSSINNLDGLAVKYDDANHSTITLKGEGGTVITNLKDAVLDASSTDAVTGKQLYQTNQNLAAETSAREQANTEINNRIGTITQDGTYIKQGDSISQNLTTLDAQVNTNTQNIANNTTNITNLQNGEGFTDAGNTYLKNLSKDAVKVAAGDRVSVDTAEDADGNKTYTVSAKNDGKVESGNTNLVSGDTVNTAIQSAISGQQTQLNADLAKKADADAGNLTEANITSWQNALGGSIASDNAGFVSGKDVYQEIHVDTDGSYVKASNTVAQNLSGLDSQVKTNADAISTNTTAINENKTNIASNTSKIAQNTESITNNMTEITNLKNLSNITDEGKTVIQHLSKDAVKVAAGDRVTVTSGEDADGNKTYTVSAKNDGKVESGNTHLVSGDTVNTAIQSAISDQQTQLNADLAKKADADASNLTDENVTSWQSKLGGSIAENNEGFVSGKDVYQEIHVESDGSYVKSSNTAAQNFSALDSQVKTNADAISTNAAKITKNTESITKNAESITKNTTSITNNTTEITNLKDLSNITDKGKTVIQNLSKNAVKVAAGDRVDVDAAEDADGNKTYTVSAKNDGKVESGNTNLVSGDTVNTAIQSAISGQQTQLHADLAKKADVDAGNLTEANVTSWQNALGGSIASDNAGFVSGKDVYQEIHVDTDGSYVKSSNTAAQNLSVLDTQVKTNANSILSLQTQVEGNVYSAGDGLTLTGKTFSAKAADSNVQISAAGIGLNPVLTNLTSASFGTSGTILNAEGLTLGSDKDAAKFTNAGISAGNQQIKNLKAGTEANDAVTVAQLMDYVAENENISITDSGKAANGQQKKTISVNTTGTVKSGDSHIVTGHTMYQELRPEDGSYIQSSNATAKNLQALDNKLGKLSKENTATVTPVVTPLANLKTVSAANSNILTANALSDDYNYLEKNVTISKNLENLDEKVKADITANANNIAANTTRIDALANSLANLPAGGNTSQTGGSTTVQTFYGDKNISVNTKGSEVTIQLEEDQNLGENGSVRFGNDKNKATTLNQDGLQVKDNNGNTAASVTKNGISATQVTVNGTDGKNIVIDKNGLDMGGKTISNVGSGIVNDANGKRDDAKSKNNVANIGDVNTIINDNLQQTRNLINETSDGEKTTINIGHSSSATSIDIARQVTDNGTTTRTNRVITGVMTDVSDATSAANVAYVNEVNAQSTQQIYRSMNSAYNRVENDISKATAGANALAALHPMEMDPEDKLQFAMGYGHYRNANAAAVGAFYTPNENMMLSIGTSFGNGDMGVNAGVTFKVGSGSNTPSLSKKQMARVINAQSQQIEAMQKAEAEKNQRIDMLAAENKEIKEKLAQILARLDAQK